MGCVTLKKTVCSIDSKKSEAIKLTQWNKKHHVPEYIFAVVPLSCLCLQLTLTIAFPDRLDTLFLQEMELRHYVSTSLFSPKESFF